MNTFSSTLSDVGVMVKRNLLRYRRLPQLVVFSFIQPVMFVLLFNYVFGGAISTGNAHYINYLLPGIFVQTTLFGSMMTGAGLAEDMHKGMIDRFRSLPMAHLAVLAGRTITEVIRNILIVAIMTLIGLLIGFRIEHGFGNYLLAMVFVVLFGFAFSWISAAIGLSVKNVEAAQTAGMIWVFPLAFASSIFVPVDSMQNGIRQFAQHNPVTYTVDTVRGLILGQDPGNEMWYSLLWIAAILLVFVPVAVRAYRKIS